MLTPIPTDFTIDEKMIIYGIPRENSVKVNKISVEIVKEIGPSLLSFDFDEKLPLIAEPIPLKFKTPLSFEFVLDKWIYVRFVKASRKEVKLEERVPTIFELDVESVVEKVLDENFTKFIEAFVDEFPEIVSLSKCKGAIQVSESLTEFAIEASKMCGYCFELSYSERKRGIYVSDAKKEAESGDYVAVIVRSEDKKYDSLRNLTIREEEMMDESWLWLRKNFPKLDDFDTTRRKMRALLIRYLLQYVPLDKIKVKGEEITVGNVVYIIKPSLGAFPSEELKETVETYGNKRLLRIFFRLVPALVDIERLGYLLIEYRRKGFDVDGIVVTDGIKFITIKELIKTELSKVRELEEVLLGEKSKNN